MPRDVPANVRAVVLDVSAKEINDHIWLVSFMHYDLGYFDHESCRLECAPNPFGAKVLPMSPE